MTDWNSTDEQTVSTVEMHYKPEEVMQHFDIKKGAYYNRINCLGIKAHKDGQGNAYLSKEQFDQMTQLDQHIQKHGTMDGFADSESGELAIANNGDLIEAGNGTVAAPSSTESEETIEEDRLAELIRAAAELKGQELVMSDLVIRAIADKMSYEDLPEEVRAKVDAARETTRPKHPSQLAEQLLQRYRSREQVA